MTTDDLWADAMKEVDSTARQPGLWARCFAEAGGDEAKAKAAYISERVKSLSSPLIKMGACPNCRKECPLGAQKCESCGLPFDTGAWAVIGDESASQRPKLPTYEGDYEPPRHDTKSKWWLWIAIPAGLFAAFLSFGFVVNSSPEAQARLQEKDAIDFCWSEQKRQSLTPDTQRFIAGACESMENAFTTKHGRRP